MKITAYKLEKNVPKELEKADFFVNSHPQHLDGAVATETSISQASK